MRKPTSLAAHLKDERVLEAWFDNEREASVLLDLIDAEFQSDPMSQQCFDARIVERVRNYVTQRAALKDQVPFYMVD